MAFAADEARESLDQLLRAAELAGRDARQGPRGRGHVREPGGLDVVGAGAALPRPSALDGQLAPAARSYRDLLPADRPAGTRDGLLALADVADARRARARARRRRQ